MASAVATKPEILVLGWLDKRKIPYDFQTSLAGGHYELGGAVVDFILPDLNLGWRVQGQYWHQSITAKAHDDVQKEVLAGMGLAVVDLWEDDIYNRLNETLELAIQGQEMLH